jgi:hypothetical protein
VQFEVAAVLFFVPSIVHLVYLHNVNIRAGWPLQLAHPRRIADALLNNANEVAFSCSLVPVLGQVFSAEDRWDALREGSAVPAGRMFNLRSRSRRWKRRAIICRPSGTWFLLWLTYPGLTLRLRAGRAGANLCRRSAAGVGALGWSDSTLRVVSKSPTFRRVREKWGTRRGGGIR